jgi:L-arabinose isomerase
LLSVIDAPDGNAKLLIAEGESVRGEILEIGNTNSRYKFPIGVRQFVNQWCSYGPAHHCAIGIGHLANELEKLAQLLNIQSIRIC